MHLTHLTLRNFRNYRALELELAPGLTVLAGDNAQGKSNLLEAIYLLALTKSPPGRERPGDGAHREPGGRAVPRGVAGTARLRDGSDLRVQVDMALPMPGSAPGLGPGGGTLRKSLRVNRAAKPAAEVMGMLSAVLFSAEDIALVHGSPAGRRRFLDVLLSQMSRDYLRTLQGYQKVLAQRNHLLRRIADGHARPDELPFWDDELCTRGGQVVQERDWAVKALAPLAANIHASVASPEPELSVVYGTRVEPGESAEETAQRLREGLEQGRPPGAPPEADAGGAAPGRPAAAPGRAGGRHVRLARPVSDGGACPSAGGGAAACVAAGRGAAPPLDDALAEPGRSSEGAGAGDGERLRAGPADHRRKHGARLSVVTSADVAVGAGGGGHGGATGRVNRPSRRRAWAQGPVL